MVTWDDDQKPPGRRKDPTLLRWVSIIMWLAVAALWAAVLAQNAGWTL